jgi:cupin fold WbuC family metalloprotein
MLDGAKTASRESPRKRIILPLHKKVEDSLQRMLNILQPGSYIRPHRHPARRAESLIVLSGTLLYLTFDDHGAVLERLMLKAGSAQFGVDTEGGIYHCFMALEPDTVLFEVKPGPYDADGDKQFAPWAPEEYSAEAAAYLEDLLQCSTTSR